MLTREAFSGQRVNLWLVTGDGGKGLVGKEPKFGFLDAVLRTGFLDFHSASFISSSWVF